MKHENYLYEPSDTWIWIKVLTVSPDSSHFLLDCSVVSQHGGLPAQSGHYGMDFRKRHSSSLIQLHNSFLAFKFYMETSFITFSLNRRKVVTSYSYWSHRTNAVPLNSFPFMIEASIFLLLPQDSQEQFCLRVSFN